MTDDAAPISRHARWRLANPDKVRDQRDRYKKRLKGLLPPYVAPPKPTPEQRREQHIDRMKRFHENRRKKMLEDPEFAERVKEDERARARDYYARKYKKGATREKLGHDALKKRKAEQKRKAYRLKHGIPLDAPIGYRNPKGTPKPKSIDQERAKRAAEVEAAKAAAVVKQSMTTETPVCPDPPELQELFRRASKGEPPRPFPASGRKRSVFHLRGVY